MYICEVIREIFYVSILQSNLILGTKYFPSTFFIDPIPILLQDLLGAMTTPACEQTVSAPSFSKGK
jgi:hypothetical protein